MRGTLSNGKNDVDNHRANSDLKMVTATTPTEGIVRVKPYEHSVPHEQHTNYTIDFEIQMIN